MASKILLDSHILVWVSEDSPRLTKETRELLAEPSHRFFFSAASIWELSIKSSVRKRDFLLDMDVLHVGLLENGYEELPVTARHARATTRLPLIHKDPFDRILIAQATIEDMLLLTSDAAITRYPGPIRLMH